MGSRRLPRALGVLAGAVLGVVGIFWFVLALMFGDATTDASWSDPRDWNHSLLLALPGLVSALVAWFLIARARQVNGEAAASSPPLFSSELRAGILSQSKLRHARPPWSFAGAIVMACVSLLQGLVVLFLMILEMGSGVTVGGLGFLVCDLAPAIVGCALAWWTIKRTRDAAREADELHEPGFRFARGAIFWIAVACVIAQAVWGPIVTFLGLAVTWTALEFSLPVVAFLIGPCLLLLATAYWLADIAFRMKPIR